LTVAFPKISKLNTPALFQKHVRDIGVQLPFEEVVESGSDSVLGQALQNGSCTIGNRFCILPMEGWDAHADGKPSQLTRRRWNNFGRSGAKLIWGGEAVAVRHDGRANPNQLLINDASVGDIAAMRESLVSTHEEHFGSSADLSIGLQLTHSGRFARPNEKTRLESKTIYAHPILDKQFGVDAELSILSDDDLRQLVDDFIAAARLAGRAGFSWVDIKHCHGYLGHEILSGFDRPGDFGGSFENRTRFLRDVVDGIRSAVPSLEIGVRLSVFDFVPFQAGPDGTGVSTLDSNYRYAWGGDESGQGIDLSEPQKFLDLMERLGIKLLCATAGSPYYNPHVQRPAAFPPSDGYLPPEDPLVGVARQIRATGELKAAHPNLIVVGSGYSYLQEWLPHVGQAAVRDGLVDSVGLGRIILAYPDLPADVLQGRTLARKRICRTFSDCTTAPRNGLVSGCYPLDAFYKKRAEFAQLAEIKKVPKASDRT
jgi:2,4-dienoyl-CoA reductase-like NADH-dependent reductase (Old Yellow Enzyme family)